MFMFVLLVFTLTRGAVAAPAAPERRAVSVPEGARLLDISTTTAWKLVYAGDIRVVRLGRSVRIPLAEIERILTGNDDHAA